MQISLTKDQVKSAPDYDDTMRDDEAYRRQHSDYYGSL